MNEPRESDVPDLESAVPHRTHDPEIATLYETFVVGHAYTNPELEGPCRITGLRRLRTFGSNHLDNEILVDFHLDGEPFTTTIEHFRSRFVRAEEHDDRYAHIGIDVLDDKDPIRFVFQWNGTIHRIRLPRDTSIDFAALILANTRAGLNELTMALHLAYQNKLDPSLTVTQFGESIEKKLLREAVDLLQWFDRCGGLGMPRHEKIRALVDKIVALSDLDLLLTEKR